MRSAKCKILRPLPQGERKAARPPFGPHKGRGKLGSQVTRDRVKNIVESAVDFMIRKTNYPESVHLQKFSAFGIVCAATIRSMLTAVQFNDKPCFKTYEIHNIGPNRLL